MAATKFQMHVSPLPDKRYQRTSNGFTPKLWGPAFQRNYCRYCTTKPEVEQSKMAAIELQMHVSPLPDKISTKFQLLAVFGVQHSIGTYRKLCYSTGSGLSKMASAKLQMHVSPLPNLWCFTLPLRSHSIPTRRNRFEAVKKFKE